MGGRAPILVSTLDGRAPIVVSVIILGPLPQWEFLENYLQENVLRDVAGNVLFPRGADRALNVGWAVYRSLPERMLHGMHQRRWRASTDGSEQWFWEPDDILWV